MVTAATLTLVPPVTLPPVRCAPWCSEGRGHIHADAPEDQFCYSNVDDDSMSIGEDGEVDVSLTTAPSQPVVVELSVAGNGNNACLSMNVAEARRFALAVLATCDLEDGVGRGGAA